MQQFIKLTKMLIIMLTAMLLSVAALATPPDFVGGVHNEYEYQEWSFLTGEPIKLNGSITISEKETADGKTVTYKFKLKPEDASLFGSLDRSVTYVTEYTKRTDKGQTIAKTAVTNYKETVNMGDDRFILEDYQFSKSDVIDNRPAADFYSGNLQGRKYYSINRGEGEVVVEMIGGNVGYENFWGSTETQIIDFAITTERSVLIRSEDEEEEDYLKDASWQGTFRVQVSDSMTKTLRYADNEAHFISFDGGHIRVTNREMISRCDYTLPKMVNGLPSGTRNSRGSVSLSQQMVPQLERLIVPKFKDIGNHWAQESIMKLYSLDVFDDASQFFLPNVPMSRVDFTKGIIRASNIRIGKAEEEPKKSGSTRASSRRGNAVNEPEEDELAAVFRDIDPKDKDYHYIKEALEKGIIEGVSQSEFRPRDPLTRAQAITIMIRVLGFQDKAPTPGYATSFSDDRSIKAWARDGIYVAREIGLVTGDNQNRINPDDVMTKAEASAMLVRFLEFLEKDLQRDYRENIILFN
jgi:hypothetical protein